MQKFFRSVLTLTKASMKMYFRNRSAVFFTLIFPLVLLAVFGFLSKTSTPSMKLDVTDYAHTELSKNFFDSLKQVAAFRTKEVDESQAASELGKGDIDLQIIIPKNFGSNDAITGALQSAKIQTSFNQAKPQNGQVANLIINQIVAGMNAGVTHTPQVFTVDTQGVQTNNLGYFDFILPGILGMIIMQSGVFAVAFAFVSFKASGALRRLQATPVHPVNFVIAQGITRLIMTFLTVAILIGFGVKFFNFHMLGNYGSFAFVVVLGILIFLGFGFAIAGYAKDENQVAPLANIVQLPMLFLSGIFFPRDGFPHWLQRVTDFFPLTYLADAMRHIANEGLHITQIKGDIFGLVAWCIIVFFLAVNLFRWE